jgi:hypothetical protein
VTIKHPILIKQAHSTMIADTPEDAVKKYMKHNGINAPSLPIIKHSEYIRFEDMKTGAYVREY